jgi:hypothetical protein
MGTFRLVVDHIQHIDQVMLYIAVIDCWPMVAVEEAVVLAFAASLLLALERLPLHDTFDHLRGSLFV